MPVPAPDRPRPGATPSGQRRAVTGISIALLGLVLVFGLRSALADDVVVVPSVAAGADAERTVSALRAADLDSAQEQAPSPTVPAGAVVELRPAAGAEVDAGSTVVVVVSTGPAPVVITASSLVGRPVGEVSDGLTALGLVAELVEDGSGQPVGAVSAVEPVGAVAVGTPVLLHVVPAPPVPAPDVEQPVGDEKDRDPGKGRDKDDDEDDR